MNSSGVAFRAHGMHCHGCERVIELALRKLPGVRSADADYPTERVTVDFDPASTTIADIHAAVERQGYRVLSLDEPRRGGGLRRFAGLVFAAAGILLVIFFDVTWITRDGEPDIARHMSLELIFLLGLLTGFHCVGMCGGFVLSYTADDARLGRGSYRSHLLYGAGKTLSYTAIGATLGLVGAVVAFTPLLRGAAGMMAGAFLIVFGLNMLGLFAPLRRFRFGLPAPLQDNLERETRSSHRPFVIGLANGLMIACGPLQAMYVMAAGAGSALEGAKMLFAFGVGTLPVLMSFGVLSTLVSASLTHRLLKASGAIVVALGAVMINRGLILTGSGYDLGSLTRSLERSPANEPTPPARPAETAPEPASTPPAEQVIAMDVTRLGFTPSRFVLVRGVPVRWIIQGRQITTCNNRIVVPSLNLEFDVREGRQVVEFTPATAGVIRWSCWMGMMRGEFEVVDGLASSANRETIAPEQTARPAEDSPPAQPAPTNMRVAPGDTLQGLAARLYGDRSRWRDILAANPGLDPRRLRPGRVLRLPEPVRSERSGP